MDSQSLSTFIFHVHKMLYISTPLLKANPSRVLWQVSLLFVSTVVLLWLSSSNFQSLSACSLYTSVLRFHVIFICFMQNAAYLFRHHPRRIHHTGIQPQQKINLHMSAALYGIALFYICYGICPLGWYILSHIKHQLMIIKLLCGSFSFLFPNQLLASSRDFFPCTFLSGAFYMIGWWGKDHLSFNQS